MSSSLKKSPEATTKRSPSPPPRRSSPRRSPSPRRSSPRGGGDRNYHQRKRYSHSPPRYRRRSPPRHRTYGSDREKRTSTTLFIGNLPYHFRERDVAEYFERCGRVAHITVGINKRTGQSKGYAFVEYEDRRDAEDAYERFNGYSLEGRRLRLDWDVGLDKKATTRHAKSPPRKHSRSPKRRSRSPSPRSRSASPHSRSHSKSPAKSNGSPKGDRKRSRSPLREASPSLDKDKKQKVDDKPVD